VPAAKIEPGPLFARAAENQDVANLASAAAISAL
jgi:hypothetical protein